MTVLSIFLIFVLIGTVEAACDPANRSKGVTCFKIFDEIREKKKTMGVEKNEEITNLCLEFKKCSPVIGCSDDKEINEIIEKVILFCDANDFADSSEFDDCNNKINAKNSICVREWHLFPAKTDDPKKNEENQRETCKNLFGKDNCLEKEVKEVCSVELWEKFKEQVKNIAKINGNCDIH